MKIMVVGGGGREHAIIKKLAKSPKVDKIYALPGNGGIAADAECVNIGAKDIDAIRDFAVENKIESLIKYTYKTSFKTRNTTQKSFFPRLKSVEITGAAAILKSSRRLIICGKISHKDIIRQLYRKYIIF